ncbi:putative type II restriction enzyme methylase subunit [Methanosarcina sp. WH1]|nr:putative type II restriction enzyme methylase subunit [Methanosarcina sp. WH1]
MFLSSYEKLRKSILNENTILSMAHFGARAFDSIGGEVVSTTAFVIEKSQHLEYKGAYLQLIDGNCEADKKAELKTKISDPFRTSAADFKKIPEGPIMYWVSEKITDIFEHNKRLESIAPGKVGLQTGSNDIFVRYWFEVSAKKTSFSINRKHDFSRKWFPYNKGGDYRKWYGNNENIVNWENDVYEIRNFTDQNGKLRSRPQNREYYFKSRILFMNCWLKR